MTPIILISILFAAIVICYLALDSIRLERDNRIAMIQWAAERAEKPLKRAPLIIHGKIGEN